MLNTRRCKTTTGTSTCTTSRLLIVLVDHYETSRLVIVLVDY